MYVFIGLTLLTHDLQASKNPKDAERYIHIHVYMYMYIHIYICIIYVYIYAISKLVRTLRTLKGVIPEKEKKKKIFRGPRVWTTTIVRLSVGENRFHILRPGKLLSRAL
jgi:hypothetical protein